MENVLKRRNFNRPSRCFVCLEEEETVYHFLIHCHWVSLLWHFSLSLMGCYMGSTFLCQRCCGGMEKKNEEGLRLRSLEDDSFVNLVMCMEGKGLSNFW